MDYAHYQFLKFLGSSPPITKKQGVSREYGTDFWRLFDIPAKSGMVGKKQNPRSSGIFPTYENQALTQPASNNPALIRFVSHTELRNLD